MCRFAMWAAFVLSTTVMASPQKPGGGDAQPRLDKIPAPVRQPGAFVTLLSTKSVLDDLKLTPEERGWLDERLKAIKAANQAAQQQIRDLPGNIPPFERMDKQKEILKSAAGQEVKAISEALTPPQYKRFRQILLQADGPSAFGRDEVLAALKLTPDQVDKIARIVFKMQNAQLDSPAGGRGSGGSNPGAKKRDLAREFTKEAVDLLTDDQKAKWKELIGEPIVEK
jgi:eukaryotic-like serine/threonine-protein kinase